MKIRLLIIVLGVVVVAVYGVLALLLTGVIGGNPWASAELTAKRSYPVALQNAQAWQADAQLVSATASWREVDSEAELDKEASWGFTFFSPRKRQLKIVAVTQQGAEEVETMDVPGQVHPVDADSWEVDSPRVLALFLDYGGRDFLARYPGATVTLRVGSEEGGERLVWLAFGIYSADRSTMTVQVDAKSGEVIGTAP